MPLYRQEKASARWGAALSRKTMADWVEAVAQWLKPIYHHMRRDLLDGGYVQADETPVRYCDPDLKKGKSGQGWLWAISRPGGEVCFDWRLSRRHEEATTLLEGFRGLLQTDGYGAYEAFSKKDEVIWIGCWAHARRKFFESLKEDPKAIGLVLKLIGRLYAQESLYRRKWTRCGTAPQNAPRHPPSHPQMAQGGDRNLCPASPAEVRPGQSLRLHPGALGVTRALPRSWESRDRQQPSGKRHSPIGVGKKNFLFIGAPEAGERSAIIYSIVVSCQRFGQDPLAYMRDVLSRLPAMTNQDDLAALCPRNWKSAS
jgi:transposase